MDFDELTDAELDELEITTQAEHELAAAESERFRKTSTADWPTRASYYAAQKAIAERNSALLTQLTSIRHLRRYREAASALPSPPWADWPPYERPDLSTMADGELAKRDEWLDARVDLIRPYVEQIKSESGVGAVYLGSHGYELMNAYTEEILEIKIRRGLT